MCADDANYRRKITKAQRRIWERMVSLSETIYIDRHGGHDTARLSCGSIVDIHLVGRMVINGILHPVSTDLNGDVQQWAARPMGDL